MTQADLAGAELMDYVLNRLKGNLKAGRGRIGMPAYWEDKTTKTLGPDPTTLEGVSRFAEENGWEKPSVALPTLPSG